MPARGHRITKVVSVGFKTILGGDTGCNSLALGLVLLGITDHTLDFFFQGTALVVGPNGDAIGLAGLFGGRDVESAVGVNIEDDLD